MKNIEWLCLPAQRDLIISAFGYGQCPAVCREVCGIGDGDVCDVPSCSDALNDALDEERQRVSDIESLREAVFDIFSNACCRDVLKTWRLVGKVDCSKTCAECKADVLVKIVSDFEEGLL